MNSRSTELFEECEETLLAAVPWEALAGETVVLRKGEVEPRDVLVQEEATE